MDEKTEETVPIIPEVKKKKKRRDIHYLFKIVFLGRPRVGKTSIFNVFRGEDFKHDSMPSVEIGAFTKYIKIDGKLVRIDIFDTCGQEKFNALTQSYARGAQGVILVSDFNDISTLGGAFEMFRELVSPQDNPAVILAGNKVDISNPLISKTIIKKTESGEMTRHTIKEASAVYIMNEETLIRNAKKINAIPLLVSAKNGLNVKPIFYQLIRVMIARQHKLMETDESDTGGRRTRTISHQDMIRVPVKTSGGCCT
ncbi:MAG: GTP-binding protein Rab-3D [Harvfovirus sp.]|uniref:GTP-binding protein Rab-3D n=1 Tax=Harvfovirus sp. TaxID=2487768 RepID=A0A3G5A6M8_9VIRU|nr:MAG: GTP-binding protein Rab-3D [Harvfovirus sp.]